MSLCYSMVLVCFVVLVVFVVFVRVLYLTLHFCTKSVFRNDHSRRAARNVYGALQRSLDTSHVIRTMPSNYPWLLIPSEFGGCQTHVGLCTLSGHPIKHFKELLASSIMPAL